MCLLVFDEDGALDCYRSSFDSSLLVICLESIYFHSLSNFVPMAVHHVLSFYLKWKTFPRIYDGKLVHNWCRVAHKWLPINNVHLTEIIASTLSISCIVDMVFGRNRRPISHHSINHFSIFARKVYRSGGHWPFRIRVEFCFCPKRCA